MMHKFFLKQLSWRYSRWLSILVAVCLLLAACQENRSPVFLGLDGEQAVGFKQAPLHPTPLPSPTAAVLPALAPDECLECHSDRDRLIETLKPVEAAAESESKGVG